MLWVIFVLALGSSSLYADSPDRELIYKAAHEIYSEVQAFQVRWTDHDFPDIQGGLKELRAKRSRMPRIFYSPALHDPKTNADLKRIDDWLLAFENNVYMEASPAEISHLISYLETASEEARTPAAEKAAILKLIQAFQHVEELLTIFLQRLPKSEWHILNVGVEVGADVFTVANIDVALSDLAPFERLDGDLKESMAMIRSVLRDLIPCASDLTDFVFPKPTPQP